MPTGMILNSLQNLLLLVETIGNTPLPDPISRFIGRICDLILMTI